MIEENKLSFFERILKRLTFKKIITIAIVAFVINFFIFLDAIHSESYKTAFEFISNNKNLISVFGVLTKESPSWSFSRSSTGSSQIAKYTFSIESGEKRGSVEVVVKKYFSYSPWEVTNANLKISDNSQRVDLLKPSVN